MIYQQMGNKHVLVRAHLVKTKKLAHDVLTSYFIEEAVRTGCTCVLLGIIQ